MGFDYETGVLASLAVSGARHVYALFGRMSRVHANLWKVRVRTSFVSGRWKRDGSLWWEVPVSLALGGVAALLSWANLVYHVYTIISGAWRHLGRPERIKELSWRLKNVDLTPRDVAGILVDLSALPAGCSASPAEREKAILYLLKTATTGENEELLFFERGANGALFAVGRDEIEKDILEKRRCVFSDETSQQREYWRYDVAEMLLFHCVVSLTTYRTDAEHLYQLRRGLGGEWKQRLIESAERGEEGDWEQRRIPSTKWESVPALHEEALEDLYRHLPAEGLPDIGVPPLSEWGERGRIEEDEEDVSGTSVG
jgi:hypothetical protein